MPLTITLGPRTRLALVKGGFSLYAFRAAFVDDTAALPTVWWRQAPLLPPLQLTWSDTLTACVSTNPVTVGQVISTAAPLPIAPGETVDIELSGNQIRRTGGRATTFANGLPAAVTCSLVQQVNGAAAPFCAFPVGPQDAQGAAAADAILLFFSNANLAVGTIVDDPAPADEGQIVDGGGGSVFANQHQGVLITDTSVARTLAFSITSGAWMWDGGVWAQTVPAVAPVIPLLILSSSPAATTSTLTRSSSTDRPTSTPRLRP